MAICIAAHAPPPERNGRALDHEENEEGDSRGYDECGYEVEGCGVEGEDHDAEEEDADGDFGEDGGDYVGHFAEEPVLYLC